MNAFAPAAPAAIGHPLHRAFAVDRLLDGLDDEHLDELRAAIDARRGVSTVTPRPRLHLVSRLGIGLLAALRILPGLLGRRAADIGGTVEMSIDSRGTVTIWGSAAGPIYVGSDPDEALRVLDQRARAARPDASAHRHAAE